MKRHAFALALAALFATPALAQDVYVIEPVHSQPSFEIRHMGFSLQRGSFGKMQGKVTLDRAAKKGMVDVTIDSTSIKTFDARLDNTVKGEKFFNVEKFPTLTYKSTSFEFSGDSLVGIDGELTMLGVTKPVKFKVANFVCGEQPFNKKPMCGAEATATIKQSEWGMMGGLPTAVADSVQISIPIEAYKE